MSTLKRFLHTTFIYFIGNVFTKLISFLLLPLYTSKLAPESFGKYDLSISILSLIVPLVFFQIWDGVYRYTFDYADRKDKIKVINNGYAVFLIGLIIYTAAYGIFGIYVNYENKVLIFLYGILMGWQYFYTYIVRCFMKNTVFVISGSVNSILNIIGNLVLILFFHMGIEALYISVIIGNIVQIIMIEIALKPLAYFKGKDIDKKLSKTLLAFSLPIGINTISYWLLSGLTRVVISNQLSVYDNGLYAVCNRFSSMIVLVVSVVQFAWSEMTYNLSADLNRSHYYSTGINWVLKVILLGSAIFLLLIKLIFPFFIAPQYQESLYIIPMTFLGVAVNSFSSFLGTVFLAEKRSNELVITTLIAAIINIVLLFILTPVFKLQGAVIALFTAFLICAFIRCFILSKRYRMHFDKQNIFYAVFVVISVGVFYFVENHYLLLISLIVLMVFSVFFMKDILRMILRTIKKKT